MKVCNFRIRLYVFITLAGFYFVACEKKDKIQRQDKAAFETPIVNKVDIPKVELASIFSRPNQFNAPTHAVLWTSGVAFTDLKKGEGKLYPVTDSVVEIRFTLWAEESMIQESKKVYKQRLGNLFQGWQMHLVEMKKGAVRRVWIPSSWTSQYMSEHTDTKKLVLDIELVNFKMPKQ